MKYMIISDLHGSGHYCEMMLQRYQEEKADKIILLGDVLYHGPRNALPEGYDPKKCTALLNEVKNDIIAVRGNCDAEIDQTVLEFPIMADYSVLQWENRTIYLTHGHIFDQHHPLPLKDGDIVISGHTHVPACQEDEHNVYLNPGSLSIPKENSYHSYMTLEGNTFQWKNLLDGQTYAECVMK